MRILSLIQCSFIGIALAAACPSGALAQQAEVATLDVGAPTYGATLETEPRQSDGGHLDGGMLAGGIVLTVIGGAGIVVGVGGALIAALVFLFDGDATGPGIAAAIGLGAGVPTLIGGIVLIAGANDRDEPALALRPSGSTNSGGLVLEGLF